jgi:glycosyltransferase involved in cell wall biosynthesis
MSFYPDEGCFVSMTDLAALPVSSDFFSVIIAANNEEDYIGACLDALLAQETPAGVLDVIVVANACTDRTEDIVEDAVALFRERGWELRCLHRLAPGKVGALNVGDAAAKGVLRAYLDADVICSPALLGQLRKALAESRPLYATGTLRVMPARSWITRHYARFWQQLPFVKSGAVGVGLFAVNAAGRQRWNVFPDIISDDTFVRLHFPPTDRIEVDAAYNWPMIEGWIGLVKVRRRQDAGVREIYVSYPYLKENEAKTRLGLWGMVRLAVRYPTSFAVYALIQLIVKARQGSSSTWTRGR